MEENNNGNNTKVTVSFRCPWATREKIEALGKRRGETLSDTVNRLVNGYISLIEDSRNLEKSKEMKLS